MNDFSLDSAISFDWFILFLRIAFIALIYFFLYQVARVSIRELVALGSSPVHQQAQATPSPSSALEVVEPAGSSLVPGDTLPLDHYTTIGRRADNSLVIDDSYVSASHAEMMFDQGAWWLVDLDSRNGTFVNERPVRARTRIVRGDVVQFGRVAVRARL
jgi:hypothetical protein